MVKETIMMSITLFTIIGIVIISMNVNQNEAVCGLIGGQIVEDCTFDNNLGKDICVTRCELNISVSEQFPLNFTEELAVLTNVSEINITNITIIPSGGGSGTGSPVRLRTYGKFAYSIWKYGKT